MPQVQFTADQLTDILNRLRPYLPTQLTTVKPGAYNLHFAFAPFTGLEPKPEEPAYQTICDDPKLCHEHWDKEAGHQIADQAEYQLRDIARMILNSSYREARTQWKNARHVTQLKKVVKDVGALWKTHQQALRAVEAAFAYLRGPQAAPEWPSAVSRLVDTHATYLNAALAFDARAQEIAEVHEDNFHEETLGHDEALAAAGYPEAAAWPIGFIHEYGADYSGQYRQSTAAGQAQRLIKEQEAHIAKVSQLTGQPNTL